ncbi:MAG: hypothetical protein H8E44_14340 [Planctomycetes bacterium]|nr:hypothetical protein [Planctomycetota bacterium]
MKHGTFTLSALASAMLMLGIGYMLPESRPIVSTPTAPVDKRIQQALAEPSALTARDLPLRDVVARLSHRHQIPISLDYAALEAEDVTGKEPVSLDVSGPALRDLLNLVLRQVHLRYAVRDGAVVITTIEARETDEPKLVGKVYLLPPSLSSRSAGEGALADLIRCTIAPQCWAWVGGPGELRVIPGALVVIQTPDIHDEIQCLLSQLDSWQESSDPVCPVYLSSGDRERTAFIEKLKQTVDVEFHETSLGDVCRHLSDKHDIPIVIDRRDLADLGLTLDAPITVDLKDVPLDTALQKMLGSLDLGYWLLDGGVIEIIQSSHGHEFLTRSYFVGDLIGPRGDGAGHDLIGTLTDLVEPQGWDFVGGASSIDLVDGQLLFVCAERHLHEEVKQFLSGLRDVSHPATSRADGLGRVQATRKVEATLRQPSTVHFENTLLEDVAEWISDTYEVEARLDPPMSPESADLPITCMIEGHSLEEALRQILRPLDRDIVVRDGVLWLAAARKRTNRPIRRLYDVGQLVDLDFGFLDERALTELVHDAAGRWDSGKEAGGWCNVAIRDGILIAYETRDIQRAIRRVLSYLIQDSRRLKLEVEAADHSREDTHERLLQRIREDLAIPVPPDDAEPDVDTPDLGMGLGGPP